MVNHSTGNIWSPTAHSLFIVNVLSTWALPQENSGNESPDGGASSYLCPFAGGIMIAAIIMNTEVSIG